MVRPSTRISSTKYMSDRQRGTGKISGMRRACVLSSALTLGTILSLVSLVQLSFQFFDSILIDHGTDVCDCKGHHSDQSPWSLSHPLQNFKCRGEEVTVGRIFVLTLLHDKFSIAIATQPSKFLFQSAKGGNSLGVDRWRNGCQQTTCCCRQHQDAGCVSADGLHFAIRYLL